MKTCRRCVIEKPVAEFRRNNKASDGLQPYCNDCQREVMRAWQAAHPGFYGPYLRAWKADKGSYFQIARANYQARKLGASGELTVEEWEAVKARYGNRCLLCGRQEPAIALTIDHVTPMRQGGINLITNVQPLCRSCNSRKFTHRWDYRHRWAARCPEILTVLTDAKQSANHEEEAVA